MQSYRPADKDALIIDLKPWIAGFVQKEYGHVDPQDQEDAVQEGCLALIQIVGKLWATPHPNLTSEEKYTHYVKQVVRNSIRDYILKLRSRFDISLYKLRRELKCECPNRPKFHLDSCKKKELGEFMTAVGDEFAGGLDEEAEDPHEFDTRQRRLSLLSGIQKSGRGMSPEACQEVLGNVLKEYRRHLTVEGRWSFQPPVRQSVLAPGQVIGPVASLPHARTPVASTAIPPSRVVKCANRFCAVDLRTVKTLVKSRAYGYCSKSCSKEWPPVVIRLQAHYEAPIEVIIEVALKLFKSKRRTAELLNIAGSTMDRLLGRFGIPGFDQ